MPNHLVAFSESQDSSNLLPLAALSDPSVTVAGDFVQIPTFAGYLIGMMGIGANITRARLVSPSLRRIVNPEIRPLNVAAEPNSPPQITLFPLSPIALDVGEQVSAEAAEDAAGAAQNTILMMLSDGVLQPVQGEIFSVRVTAAVTLAAYTWTNGALTFDQNLPVGNYQIVGARFESAGLLAFRFVFQGAAHRPGGIGCDSAADLEPELQRFGGLGSWGEFVHNTPPTVDFLSLSADTSEVGVIDLIKVG